jgi:hypothetical protein
LTADVIQTPRVPSPALAGQLKQLLATEEPPCLGPERRTSVWSEAKIGEALSRSADTAILPPQSSQLLRCVVLLWHDHLDAAHQIAQAVETPDGSWLHGIMHRREADYWNAKYWFRRAGAHPAFSALAQRAKEILVRTGAARLSERLIENGHWNASGFVDAVEAALGPRSLEPERSCLRQLQAAELQTAFDWFLTRS